MLLKTLCSMFMCSVPTRIMRGTLSLQRPARLQKSPCLGRKASPFEGLKRRLHKPCADPRSKAKISAKSLILLYQKYVITNITFLLETTPGFLHRAYRDCEERSSRRKINKRSKGHYHEEDRNFPHRPGRSFNGFTSPVTTAAMICAIRTLTLASIQSRCRSTASGVSAFAVANDGQASTSFERLKKISEENDRGRH